MQIQIQSPLSPPILWFKATGLGELPNTMRDLRRKGYRACRRLCAAQVFAGAKIVELSVIYSPIFGPTLSPPLPASKVPPFSKSAVRLPPHTASRRARRRWVKMVGGRRALIVAVEKYAMNGAIVRRLARWGWRVCRESGWRASLRAA